MGPMKFSIIIPVHNSEQYLNECIDSIYSQEFDDFEVIFVVNGSNDSSEDICLMARECHSNIRVIVTDAVGVSSARNIGLREARGEYIVFVDSDDRLLPGALHTYANAAADSLDIITCNYLRSKRKRMSGLISDVDRMTYIKAMLDAPAYFKPSRVKLTRQPIVLLCVFAKAFRREFLVSGNVSFDADIAIGEDTLFMLKAVQCAGSIRCVDTAVYYYRPGPQTVSSAKDISGVAKRLASAGRLLDRTEDLPEEIRECAQMKVIDIVLRSIVIGSACGENKKAACEAIRAFLKERKLGRIFVRCRKGSLSIVSADEDICYQKMMESLRMGELVPAFKVAEKHNEYLQKKEQLKQMLHL